LGAGEEQTGVRDRHRQQRGRAAAGDDAQGTLRRDLLRRPAHAPGAPRDRLHPPQAARPGSGSVRSRPDRGEERGDDGSGDRAGHRLRAVRRIRPGRQVRRAHYRRGAALAAGDGAAFTDDEGEDRGAAQLVQDARAARLLHLAGRRGRRGGAQDRDRRGRQIGVSHFTQVETKINDLVALKAALEELGLQFEEAAEDQVVKVRGWKGSTLTAEAKIKASKSYDIGLQLTEEGTYKLVADWWGIEEETNETQEKITQRIVQRYEYHKVKKEVTRQGFTRTEEQVKPAYA